MFFPKSNEFCVGLGVRSIADKVGLGVSTLIALIEGSYVTKDDGMRVSLGAVVRGLLMADACRFSSFATGTISEGTSPRNIL